MPSAEDLYEQIKVALQNGDSGTACQLAKDARDMAPGDSRFVLMHGVALRRNGQHKAAEPLLRQILVEAEGLVLAHHELGLALKGQGRLSEAIMSLETAVRLQPSLKTAWRDLYELRASQGDDVAAADAYRRSLGSQQGLDPLLTKVLDLMQAGRLGAAEGICREYLKRRPHDVDAIRLLAEIGITLGMLDEAIVLLERCLALAPNFTIAQANYATALARRQRFDEALDRTGRLQTEQPDNLSHKVQHASILAMAGRFEQAHEKFEEVLTFIPDNARILTSYGHSLRYGGRGEDAAAAYQRAIAAEPDAGEAYWSLANLKTFKFADAELDGMRQRYAAMEKLSADRYHLAFALGKALEDKGDFAESFAAYADGNTIKNTFSSYTTERTSGEVDSMIEHCADGFLEPGGHTSNEPIFILGLPRAGSTLLEQILASHSAVEATAELPLISQIAGELGGGRRRSEQNLYPQCLTSMSQDQRESLGQRYLDGASTYRTDKPFFIDKMPNNWVHIGLIKTILPNATIIDARRHPMAACFANFKQLFARGQEFTYGLEEIGHYYADYMRLMDHWHSVLPHGLMTVQYETVVEDLETQVRVLLDHCNLPFEEQCLRYYEKDRAVRTASSEQVRQPIYRDALSVWQRYEAHLDPLKAVLDERGIAY
ncbi:MAG: tetratricopeptide repeat-containing sulfotransferase family protein [Luminiphilus sp.]|jgi:tetratricopeptide (TPR) repeat protein